MFVCLSVPPCDVVGDVELQQRVQPVCSAAWASAYDHFMSKRFTLAVLAGGIGVTDESWTVSDALNASYVITVLLGRDRLPVATCHSCTGAAGVF
jgi:hypothetical protein